MHYIGAGEAELHWRACGHLNAARHKVVLLGDEPHRDGTVRLDGGAEIAFDKLALEMEGCRVDDLDIAGRVQPIDDTGRDDDRDSCNDRPDGRVSERPDRPGLEG